jgi:probable rRNA maturation factor
MTDVSVDCVAESDLWEALPDAEIWVERACAAAVAGGRRDLLPNAEIAVLLADDAHVQAVNKEWRGLDKPTNVLSFPAVLPDRIGTSPILGDLILAFETCAREAEQDGKTLRDHAVHLVVHGVLHLLGYDHLDEVEAEEMEALEIEVLAGLGIPDPYRDSEIESGPAVKTRGP